MNSLLDQQTETDFLAELVGEGKKFKDTAALARGKWESDTHIKTLETENSQLRNDYLALKADSDARKKLEDLIADFGSQRETSSSATQTNDGNKSAIDFSQIESLVDKKLRAERQAEAYDRNFKFVETKLKEKYGPSYQTTLKKQIDELGLTAEQVDKLARETPTLAIKALGLDAQPVQQTFMAPPASQVRRDNFKPMGEQKRYLSYYEDMRKTNPKLYRDPKINLQMEADAQLYGEAFFDV